MRRLLLLPIVLLAAGCMSSGTYTPEKQTNPALANTGQANRPGSVATQPSEKVEGNEERDETGFEVAYPVRAHRARRFYLQGVKLLIDPPRVDEAIREFQLALEMDPLFYKSHFKLGICYYHKGQYNLEIAEYRKCLAINRNYAPAWLNLGHAYLARDELEAARDAYEEVLGLSPDNRVALYNLGLVEFDLRLFDDSHKHLDRFLKVDGSGEMGEKARQYLDEIRLRRTQGS